MASATPVLKPAPWVPDPGALTLPSLDWARGPPEYLLPITLADRPFLLGPSESGPCGPISELPEWLYGGALRK